MIDRDIITPEEATQVVPLTRRAIYYHISEGRLPAIKVGRRFYLRRSELEAVFSGQQPAPTPDKPRRINPRFFQEQS